MMIAGFYSDFLLKGNSGAFLGRGLVFLLFQAIRRASFSAVADERILILRLRALLSSSWTF
jgi:hypothetical protein